MNSHTTSVIWMQSGNILLKRMHSSRMRTARSLTACRGGGGCAWRGVHCRGLHMAGGACMAGGHAWQGVGAFMHGRGACMAGRHALHAHPPPRTPPCGQTDTCENITFANFVCGRHYLLLGEHTHILEIKEK